MLISGSKSKFIWSLLNNRLHFLTILWLSLLFLKIVSLKMTGDLKPLKCDAFATLTLLSSLSSHVVNCLSEYVLSEASMVLFILLILGLNKPQSVLSRYIETSSFGLSTLIFESRMLNLIWFFLSFWRKLFLNLLISLNCSSDYFFGFLFEVILIV